MGKTFNAVADGYFVYSDWVKAHPHWASALWAAMLIGALLI